MASGASTWCAWVIAIGAGAAVVPACSANDGGDTTAEGGRAGSTVNGSGGSSGSGSGGSSGSIGSGGSSGSIGTGGSSGSIGTGGTIGGVGGSAGGGADSGCNKIDFLFVIDNSISMEQEQAALVASFPGFVSAIQSTVQAGSDFHIMVVDTDAWGRCNTANWTDGISPNHASCNDYIKTHVFEECDRTLGAGVIHPAGGYASNAICPIPEGRRYLQEGDPNIPDLFACMAKVGTAGHSSERPMDAMVAALQSGINGPGGCNAGFLRDDAVLVITFISDDPNYEDSPAAPLGPEAWYNAVLAAKHGDPNAVVVLGIIPNDTGCGNAALVNGKHWAEFVAKWPSSLRGSICDADYSPLFSQAVGIIDDTCDNYVPPIPQ